jgi:hypothetical protein
VNNAIPAGYFLITFVTVVLFSITATYLQESIVVKLILETRVGRRFADTLTTQFIK